MVHAVSTSLLLASPIFQIYPWIPTETLFSVERERILGMGEPGGLPFMGPHRVGHNWSDLAAYIYMKIKQIPWDVKIQLWEECLDWFKNNILYHQLCINRNIFSSYKKDCGLYFHSFIVYTIACRYYWAQNNIIYIYDFNW